jgi:hypothetical protein
VASPPKVPAVTDDFPPEGTYATPAAEITRYTDFIWTRRYLHPIPPITPLPPIIPRPPPCLSCPPEIYRFDTDLIFELSLDGGKTWNPVQAVSQVGVRSDQVMAVGEQRVFRDEMIQLQALIELPGTPGVWLRESPTRRSTGASQLLKTTVGDPFQVDSFFDIWTEISLDGGHNWIPSQEPSHVELQRPAVQ